MTKEELKQQVITEQDIVEVLENIYWWKDESEDDYHKRLAAEILSKAGKWEVVDRIKIYGNKIVREFDIGNIKKPAIIEIAVRVRELK